MPEDVYYSWTMNFVKAECLQKQFLCPWSLKLSIRYVGVYLVLMLLCENKLIVFPSFNLLIAWVPKNISTWCKSVKNNSVTVTAY